MVNLKKCPTCHSLLDDDGTCVICGWTPTDQEVAEGKKETTPKVKCPFCSSYISMDGICDLCGYVAEKDKVKVKGKGEDKRDIIEKLMGEAKVSKEKAERLVTGGTDTLDELFVTLMETTDKEGEQEKILDERMELLENDLEGLLGGGAPLDLKGGSIEEEKLGEDAPVAAAPEPVITAPPTLAAVQKEAPAPAVVKKAAPAGAKPTVPATTRMPPVPATAQEARPKPSTPIIVKVGKAAKGPAGVAKAPERPVMAKKRRQIPESIRPRPAGIKAHGTRGVTPTRERGRWMAVLPILAIVIGPLAYILGLAFALSNTGEARTLAAYSMMLSSIVIVVGFNLFFGRSRKEFLTMLGIGAGDRRRGARV